MEVQEEQPMNKISEHNTRMELIEEVADLLCGHCSERSLPIFNGPNVKSVMIEMLIGLEPVE